MEDYQAVNQQMWDERVPAHAASPDYAVERFVADPEFISDVVRFDLPRLGDISGLRGVHLQCHIGTDTVSLSRLGARMVGLDFSEPAVLAARSLADRAHADVQFVTAPVYDAVEVLGRARFDLVFTGVGALCWLPDISRWASVVAALLAPGGRLFLREGHPMLCAMADADLSLRYSYFERPEPDRCDEDGTYVSTDASFTHTVSYAWNHGLGEVVTALLDHGLQLIGLVEHDTVPWPAIEGHMSLVGHGEWQLTEEPWRLAHSYTLQARRPV